MTEIYHRSNSDRGLLILHGGSAGVESSFVQKLFQKGVDHNLTVLAYDFPYKVAGKKETSPGFAEEISTIKVAVERLHQDGVTDLHVVAKSVGSAILASALEQDPTIGVSKITIMGLPIGITKLAPFKNKSLHIVHGEYDRFGDLSDVKEALRQAGIKAPVDEIKDATHSFRDKETDSQPIHEDEAISKVSL